MGRVQILDDHHLVAGGEAFARSDDRPGEKQLPNLPSIRFDHKERT
jgi:hypothetical protein